MDDIIHGPACQLQIPGDTILCQSGDILISPEIEGNYIYEIIEGLVKVYAVNNRKQSIHVLYGPGEIFPLTWMIGKRRLDAFVEAFGPVKLRRFRKDVFAQAIGADLAVASVVIRKLVLQVSLYAARIDNLEYKYASERLAYRLVFLAQRFGKPVSGGIELPPLTNQEIGQTINLSRESVNRELARFARLGLVENRNGALCIVNLAGLRREASKAGSPLYVEDFRME